MGPLEHYFDVDDEGGQHMIDDMGILHTSVHISTLHDIARVIEVRDVMVDTGSAYNWLPRGVLEELGITVQWMQRFEMADGSILERPVGYAMIHAGGKIAPTIVAFAEPGDLVLLGAHGLEGLNLRVDLNRRALVPGGPVPAATA
jgi:predicted aspartyl protease